MESYEIILRKVGLALIIVGLLDILIMIYCIINSFSYASSFNIFSIIAGCFLLKKNLRATKIITFFSAFMLTGFVGMLLIFPFLQPFQLTIITFKLNPISTISLLAFFLLVIGVIFWVYKNLSSESVMQARKDVGLGNEIPKLAFLFGGILIIGLSLIMFFLNNSNNAMIAKSKAAEQFGSTYNYHVTSMNLSGNNINARLTAYKENEIKQVYVEWNK